MNEEEPSYNPENNMQDFTIPATFLQRLYDFTGSSENDRGFCLAYVNQGGQVMIMQKSETQIIDLGLRKGLEKFLIDMEESEGRMDINGNDE